MDVKNLSKYKNKLIEKEINHIHVNNKYSFDITINQPIREETRRKGKKILNYNYNDLRKIGMGS